MDVRHEIEALLRRKAEIVRANQTANNMARASYTEWMVSAVELLLRIELEKR